MTQPKARDCPLGKGAKSGKRVKTTGRDAAKLLKARSLCEWLCAASCARNERYIDF